MDLGNDISKEVEDGIIGVEDRFGVRNDFGNLRWRRCDICGGGDEVVDFLFMVMLDMPILLSSFLVRIYIFFISFYFLFLLFQLNLDWNMCFFCPVLLVFFDLWNLIVIISLQLQAYCFHGLLGIFWIFFMFRLEAYFVRCFSIDLQFH